MNAGYRYIESEVRRFNHLLRLGLCYFVRTSYKLREAHVSLIVKNLLRFDFFNAKVVKMVEIGWHCKKNGFQHLQMNVYNYILFMMREEVGDQLPLLKTLEQKADGRT